MKKTNNLLILGVFLVSQFVFSQINAFQDFETIPNSGDGNWKWDGSAALSSLTFCNGEKSMWFRGSQDATSYVTYTPSHFVNDKKVDISFYVKTKQGPYPTIISGTFYVQYKKNDGDYINIYSRSAQELIGDNCQKIELEIPSGTFKREDKVVFRFFLQCYKDSTTEMGAYVDFHMYLDDISITQDYSDFVIFAEPNGTGDGTSWEKAMDLADALKWAQNNVSKNLWSFETPLSIWAKKGTYFPKYDATGTTFGEIPSKGNWMTFYLPHNVKVFGGFDGSEAELSERILPKDQNYSSILSGDFNSDDEITDNKTSSVTIANNSENAFHVVVSETPYYATQTATELNGFTIKGGNANGDSNTQSVFNMIYDFNGGAIFTNKSLAQFNNLKLYGNSAKRFGGAIFNYQGNIKSNNILVINNVGEYGSGIVNEESAITLSRATITNNYAMLGNAGFYSKSENPLFNTTSTITNSLIANNYSKNKGGIGIEDPMSQYYFTNTTVVNHLFQHTITGNVKFRNSIIWDNLPTTTYAEYSLIKGRDTRDNHNIDAEPYDLSTIFVNANNQNYRPRLRFEGDGYFYIPSITPNISNQNIDLEEQIISIQGPVYMGAYQFKDSYLGITDLQKKSSKIYPVPVKDILTINNPEAITSINIYDAAGRLLINQKINNQTSININTSELKKGFYILKVDTKSKSETISIIK